MLASHSMARDKGIRPTSKSKGSDRVPSWPTATACMTLSPGWKLGVKTLMTSKLTEASSVAVDTDIVHPFLLVNSTALGVRPPQLILALYSFKMDTPARKSPLNLG